VKPFVVSIRNSVSNPDELGDIVSCDESVLLGELDKWLESVNRPRVVLDCSELEGMGLREIGILMSCLERVMKRNGDARLAGLSPRAREILSHAGIDGLFRIYDSKENAMRSFDLHPNFELVNDNGFE
jgi:anti-anti-sigma factor